MVIDITLAFIFIASLFTIWYRISVKIPELIAIPDEVITARLQEDSARLRLFALHFKIYWKERKYQEVFWKYFNRALYRFHILLMRFDNRITVFLKAAKTHAGAVNGNGSGEYWKQLQQDLIPPVTTKDNRIREVKVKK